MYTKETNTRKVLFVSGTRADYGKLKTLIELVNNEAEYEVGIFTTGMHMLSSYGLTYEEIEKSGLQDNMFLYINQSERQAHDMDLILANTVSGLGYFIRQFPPDMIVVHGDRVEALAGAIVGALNNILVAHVEGGEISGTVDELMRHATSKLAHLHFVANDEAKKRLIQMGELANSIFVVGSPDIDVMLSDTLPDLAKVRERYEIPFDKYAILIYHPVTTELDTLVHNVNAVTDAVIESEQNFVVIQPNNDRGTYIIQQAFRQLRELDRFRMIPSMRFEYFLTLLKNARAIVGNSSAGIREAPVYGVPTINIGSRQLNRFKYESIVNVPENKERIVEALANLNGPGKPSMHFGRGDSAKQFLKIIANEDLWTISRQKQFHDLSRLL